MLSRADRQAVPQWQACSIIIMLLLLLFLSLGTCVPTGRKKLMCYNSNYRRGWTVGHPLRAYDKWLASSLQLFLETCGKPTRKPGDG